MADYAQWDNAITPLSGDEQVVIFQNGHEVKTDASNFGGGALPGDGFPNQALLFGNPPFWGTDIIGRAGDDDFPTGDTVTLTGGGALSPTSGSAGGVRLTGGISGPGQTASQFLIENTSGGEGGLIQINAGTDGTGGSIGAIINLSAGGFTGSGHGGVVELVPGTGTSPGFLLLTNLPTSAPAQPTGVWNNSGVLNIGPGGGGGSGNTITLTADTNIAAGSTVSVNSAGHATQTWGPTPNVTGVQTVIANNAVDTSEFGLGSASVSTLASGSYIFWENVANAANAQWAFVPVTTSGTSLTVGTISTGSDPSRYPSFIIPLSSSTFAVVYIDGGTQIGSISGGVISFGSIVSSALSFAVSGGALSATKIVIVDGTNGEAVVGLISGTTVSFPTAPLLITSGTIGGSRVATTEILSSSSFAVAYSDGANNNLMTAVACTVSGTTITPGTPVASAISSNGVLSTPMVLSSTAFVVAWQDSATGLGWGTLAVTHAAVASVSGTTVSWGAVVQLSYAGSRSLVLGPDAPMESSFGGPFIAATVIDSTHVAIGAGGVLPQTITVSGTSLSVPTAIPLSSDSVAPAAMSNSIFLPTAPGLSNTNNPNTVGSLAINSVVNCGGTLMVVDGASAVYEVSSSGARSPNVIHPDLWDYGLSPIDSTHALAWFLDFNMNFKGRVITLEAINASPPIGCSASAVTSGNPATITLSGACAGFTGLTPGAQYYANGDGSLTTANIGHPMGVATSTTQLTVIVK